MKKPKGKVDKEQFDVVMRTFERGKLRIPTGKTVESKEQALAIAYREGRAAEEHGKEMRTFKGRRRMRPKLSD